MEGALSSFSANRGSVPVGGATVLFPSWDFVYDPVRHVPAGGVLLQALLADVVSSPTAIFSKTTGAGLDVYLYGLSTVKNDRGPKITEIEEEIKTQNPGTEICPAHWGKRSIAFRCLDCEYDSNCIVCPDCFFHSDHAGHRTMLIRTQGGACDCGRLSGWF